jgi:hypothetical protein
MSITVAAGKRSGMHDVTGVPASFKDRIFTRSRPCLRFAVLLLCLSPILQGQDRQMKVSSNRTLVLKSYVLVEPVDGTSAVPLYTIILQKDPFVEIHLQTRFPKAR